jgi:aminomethyltransferase
MFDVSHMQVVDLVGARSRLFLEHVLANDVAKLAAPGRALYTCMLAEDGGVLDDLIAYYLGPEFFRLVLNAATAERDLGWLVSHRQGSESEPRIVPRRDLAIIAVQGPRARQLVWGALSETELASASLAPFHAAFAGDIMIARTGYTGEDGFELVLPEDRAPALWRALVAAGVRPAGLGARDTLRLEAGLNLYGQDMDENVTPFEANLGWTVDTARPRDFVGRAGLCARRVAHALLGLVSLGGGVMRTHQRVVTRHGDGETTSGTFSPTLGRSIALARLPAAARPGDEATVELRGKPIPARIVKPPFARHGRALY